MDERRLWTPNGIRYAIKMNEIKLKELHDITVSAAHRKQSEHPRTMAMSESEFREWRRNNVRCFLNKRRMIQEEINRLTKLLEKI